MSLFHLAVSVTSGRKAGIIICSGGQPSRGAKASCNLSPDQVDVMAQVIHLVRESKRKMNFAEIVLDALNLSLFVDQLFVACD
jgi:hypothetical protein